MKYIWKKCYKNFFGRPYHSDGTKIHLDAALVLKFSGICVSCGSPKTNQETNFLNSKIEVLGTRRNCRRQHFDWWCHDWKWHVFGVPKQLRIWFSWKMEVSHMKALSFYFQNLNTELKNLFSIKSYGSLKIVYRFFHKECWRQQNYGNLGTNW